MLVCAPFLIHKISSSSRLPAEQWRGRSFAFAKRSRNKKIITTARLRMALGVEQTFRPAARKTNFVVRLTLPRTTHHPEPKPCLLSSSDGSSGEGEGPAPLQLRGSHRFT